MKSLEVPLLAYQEQLQIRTEGKQKQIFDPVRRKWLVLQAEEWLRQLWIQYLKTEKAYPFSKMQVEKGLAVYGQKQRTDLLLFDKNTQPLVLFELKAPRQSLNAVVLDQIMRYNSSLQMPYLIISNGRQNYGFVWNPKLKEYEVLGEIPFYAEN